MYSALVLCAIEASGLQAQSVTTLFSFDGVNGAGPRTSLIQGTNGDFYGTAPCGGTGIVSNCSGYGGNGTIFKITPSGTLTTLYNFCPEIGCTDGSYANPLIQAANGEFYGTTRYGGAQGGGTVFKMTPSGTLTTLYAFCSQNQCGDGQTPFAGLIQASNGYIYGTTYSGGPDDGGTVFKISPGGVLTTIYSFCSKNGCSDGSNVQTALIQATNGDLYGTTTAGGNASDAGTVFRITPSGALTTIYRFCANNGCPDGSNPETGLIQASDGDLYGATLNEGANNEGTVFKITLAGALTTLHSFCSQNECTDGDGPNGLAQATNGDIYGTTNFGGLSNFYGTIYSISPNGMFTSIYAFSGAAGHGYQPAAGIFQSTNGDLYGTTQFGGAADSGPCAGESASGCGTIFRLSVGLGPFVETEPASGAVGSAVRILGNGLTTATSVTFDGTPASFTVVSNAEIMTTVPVGAASGTVQVTTSGSTLSSNLAFRVP